MKQETKKRKKTETKFLSTQFQCDFIFKNRVTFHCSMFDSLTKYVQHFRWISICFMIAKNVCSRYICIFPFACCFLFIFRFLLAFFHVQKPLFFRTDSTLQYALFKFGKFNIYKYFDQIKAT